MSLHSYEKNLWIARIVEFENPRKIKFGVDSVSKLGAEAKNLGAGKVFLVTDTTIKNVGILEKAMDPMRKEGLEIDFFEIPVKEPEMESAHSVADNISARLPS